MFLLKCTDSTACGSFARELGCTALPVLYHSMGLNASSVFLVYLGRNPLQRINMDTADK